MFGSDNMPKTEVKVIENSNVQDVPCSNQDDSLKMLVLGIKKYAEKHTALFLGICSALFAVLTFVVNFFSYCYQVGYYSLLNIDIQHISLFVSVDNNVLYRISFYIAFACIMIVVNLIGYELYKKRKLIVYFLFLTMLLMLVIIIVVFISIGIEGIIDHFYSVLRLAGVYSFATVFCMLTPVVSHAASLPDEETIIRLELKLKKLNKDSIRKKRKIEKCQDKIEKLKNKKSQVPQGPINQKLNVRLASCMIVILLVLVLVVIPMGLGSYQSTQNRTYKTLNRSVLAEVSDATFEKYVVLFEDDEYIILAPCNDTVEVLTIDTSRQLQVKNENLILERQTYNSVVILSDKNCFESVSETERLLEQEN